MAPSRLLSLRSVTTVTADDCPAKVCSLPCLSYCPAHVGSASDGVDKIAVRLNRVGMPFGSSAALPHLGCSTMSRRTGLHLTCKSRASGADSMIKTILLVMAFVFLPSVAFAQTATDPGEGTDLYRVNREVEAMTRDGRWQRLLDEANGVRQAVTPAVPFPQSSTHTPVRPRALAELRLACQDESRKLFKGPRRMDPDLYKRVVERRQLYVRSCIDSGPQDVELTGSSTSTTIPLPPRRPVARL